MYKNLFSRVGVLTLLSRGTGFFRDVMLGAFLGAGVLADAFYIAFRLPNHFRTIFGEGAFNAAYVPSYSRVLETEGPHEAKRFASQVFTLLLLSQVLLLGLAWAFTPQLLDLLAPGLDGDPRKLNLAIVMTRITFPYLLFITLVTLHSGTLNANERFTAAAFAPVLLNVVVMAFLAVAYLFPDAGVAASFGVTVSGLLQLVLLMIAARRAGILEGFARPRWGADIRQFFGALAPAVIGSAGTQIALFADTIIGSMLPTGGISSIYYADRLYQLPIGVIGIAAGTVLLPEMSRLLALSNKGAALHAQNRTMALTIMMSAPFFIAFLTIPDLIMRGVFEHGRFTEEAAAASAAVLAAYGCGLMAIVLIRSAVASFQAEGNTRTPMIVSLIAVGCNLALKIVLFRPWGAVGLATATAVGAWINFGLLVVLATRRGTMRSDATLIKVTIGVAIASIVLAGVAIFGDRSVAEVAQFFGRFSTEAELLLLGALGGIVYGLVLAGALAVMGVPIPVRLRRRWAAAE